MGIDIYLKWDGMTQKERKNQITGFSIIHGYRGYLREAYHGEPYATKKLITENWYKEPVCKFCEKNNNVVKEEFDTLLKDKFDDDYDKYNTWVNKNCKCGFVIPNKVLQKRLPAVLKAAKERSQKIYKEDSKEAEQSFIDFVHLHLLKEKSGKNPRIVVSG